MQQTPSKQAPGCLWAVVRNMKETYESTVAKGGHFISVVWKTLPKVDDTEAEC